MSSSEITDEYIKQAASLSSKYNSLDEEIESIRINMAALRHDLFSIFLSKDRRDEIGFLIKRYTVAFREFSIERDKIPKILRIRIPHHFDYFPRTPATST